MFFKYGSFQHTANEVTLSSFTKRRVYNDREQITSTVETMSIQGVLIADGQAAIDAKIAQIEQAYAANDRDAGLFRDNGSATQHFLDSSKSMNGVRVLSLNWDRADRAEFATGRTYRILLQAEFIGGNDLIGFQESLRFIGSGGRRVIAIPTLTGLPQLQVTNQRTPVRIVQSGNALGMRDYPAFPPVIFSQTEDGSLRVRVNGPPKAKRRIFIDWPINWSYTSVLQSGAFGEPHRR